MATFIRLSVPFGEEYFDVGLVTCQSGCGLSLKFIGVASIGPDGQD